MAMALEGKAGQEEKKAPRKVCSMSKSLEAESGKMHLGNNKT